MGKPGGKRPLGRPRHRWRDNITMDLLEVGRGGMDWIDPAQDRGRWRDLMNTVLKDLYDPGGACSTKGERRVVYRVWVGKPEGKRPLGRPRYRWKDNITMDLQEVGFGGMDWIELAQDRDRWRALMNEVMNLGLHKMRGIS